MIDNINWYPGHMKKTRELIKDNLKLVDLVIEVIDARIPQSSRNPIIDELVGEKPRLIVLNKSDLADEEQNREWVARFESEGSTALIMNCMSGAGVKQLFKVLDRMNEARKTGSPEKKADSAETTANAGSEASSANAGSAKTSPAVRSAKASRPYRMMIVGVPNVGKSSLINRMTGKKSTQTGDRPGVTKGKQWLTLKNGMQLLDTPGILWPKFEDPKAGLNLAFCGSIKDEILDTADLAFELITVLQESYPELLMERYKLDELEAMPLDNMEAIAAKRGFLLPGKKIDYERTGRTVLDEFRGGKIGRITLERV